MSEPAKKICFVDLAGPLYRTGIFRKIDREYDVEWYFGDAYKDIQRIDPSLLKKVSVCHVKFLFGTPFYWFSGFVSSIASNRYDTYVIGGELYSLSEWAILILRRLFFRKKRIFLWSHGWYGHEGSLKTILKKWFFNMADATLLYGNYAQNLMISNGLNPTKLHVIHNSLDYDSQCAIRESITPTDILRNHFKNDDPVIIFIGRLTVSKKLGLLLDAIDVLKNKGFNYNLVIVGDGEDKAQLQLKAKKLELPVWFYGACYDERQNSELIFNADLCVSPGNVGLTAIHCLTYGTPVITHDTFMSQGPEFEVIKEGVTGGFFKKDDINSLADSIQRWFSKNSNSRNVVREACFSEIANSWTPDYQINIFNKVIK